MLESEAKTLARLLCLMFYVSEIYNSISYKAWAGSALTFAALKHHPRISSGIQSPPFVNSWVCSWTISFITTLSNASSPFSTAFRADSQVWVKEVQEKRAHSGVERPLILNMTEGYEEQRPDRIDEDPEKHTQGDPASPQAQNQQRQTIDA